MAIKLEREYRDIELSDFQFNKDQYIVEGYAAIFDKPYVIFTDEDGNDYYEIISSKAFANTDMSDIIFLYNHEGMVFARNTNDTLDVIVDDIGLFTRTNLVSTQASHGMFEAIDTGLVTKMSWAFTVRADEYDRKTRTRTITDVRKIFDVSAVALPANPATNISSISARSFINGVIAKEEAERLLRANDIKKIQLKLKLGGNS